MNTTDLLSGQVLKGVVSVRPRGCQSQIILEQ